MIKLSVQFPDSNFQSEIRIMERVEAKKCESLHCSMYHEPKNHDRVHLVITYATF